MSHSFSLVGHGIYNEKSLKMLHFSFNKKLSYCGWFAWCAMSLESCQLLHSCTKISHLKRIAIMSDFQVQQKWHDSIGHMSPCISGFAMKRCFIQLDVDALRM